MKHSITATLILVGFFLAAQITGLFIINQYIDQNMLQDTGKVIFSELPYAIERPPIEEAQSFMYIFSAIIIGTALLFLLIKFRKPVLWKVWFFMAVMMCLTIALGAFIDQRIALVAAIVLAAIKIFKPNFLVQNFTEILVYGGLAAIFVPIMNISSASILLILIAGYDAFAVWKSKHMIKLAQFQRDSKVFAGLLIPYHNKERHWLPYKGESKYSHPMPKKAESNSTTIKDLAEHKVKLKTNVRNAVLGGGDIGFPLLFSGVVMKTLLISSGIMLAFSKTIIISICAAAALLGLLLNAHKDKYYPAMPFISAGCFIGYGIILLI